MPRILRILSFVSATALLVVLAPPAGAVENCSDVCGVCRPCSTTCVVGNSSIITCQQYGSCGDRWQLQDTDEREPMAYFSAAPSPWCTIVRQKRYRFSNCQDESLIAYEYTRLYGPADPGTCLATDEIWGPFCGYDRFCYCDGDC
jgi:hypothetical protein